MPIQKLINTWSSFLTFSRDIKFKYTQMLAKMLSNQKLLLLGRFLIMILQFSGFIVQCQDLCYLSKKVALPSDVVPPPDVTCGAGKVLGGIPNVSVNGKTFADFDFTKRPKDKSVANFALTQFSAVNGTSKDSLLTAGKLYDAVNAALRSRGQKKFLSQVKLMDFFIASQNDRNAQNAAGTTRNIDKAVKNCGRDCVGNEADRMKALKI
ncbi:hypothetical protein PCASD_11028 [Puccinia coronata f. sp. avenae]|uniref:DUF7143 domain-containing protein n=1 Tax=Puccinia coronata f. sp. avenae TaxID=200324 RepID=A0A2N5TCB0_9BASI|nr:hypothetical protein PCASD_11028 [Puccinia coronata f. sp. avenae]